MGFTVFVVVLWARFMVVVKGCCGGVVGLQYGGGGVAVAVAVAWF